MRKAMLNCSPVELIAMATGRRGAAAVADAHKLMEKVGLKKLSDAGTAEIQAVCKGMTNDVVRRLMAGVEIGLRIAELKTDYESSTRISSPATAMKFCLHHFGRMRPMVFSWHKEQSESAWNGLRKGIGNAAD